MDASTRRVAAAVAVALITGACAAGPTAGPSRAIVRVVDETGRPLHDAVVEVQTGRFVADERGVVRVELAGPVSGTITGEGMLTEPVVLGPGDDVEIRLWARRGSDGTVRTALHLGGDVMMGRRYLQPIRPDTARLLVGDGGASARRVVEDLAPLFAAADVSVVNLETVVGEVRPEEALPGKRFLLDSPPEIVGALTAMGVDVAVGGNNHAYDWGDAGVLATATNLETAGIAFTGAGLDEGSARRPARVRTPGGWVTILSYTTLDGDYVNDQLPTSADPIPEDPAEDLRWMFRPRLLEYGRPGETAWLRAGRYLPGDAWRWFQEVEGALGVVEAARVWRELTAEGLFPQLQDWVARRGHGGAAAFSFATIGDDLAGVGEGLTVVELHSGFQYSASASRRVRRAARAAIDAGADLVVAHHPHVLQGFEWYGGRLIAHSLGNLVFDQDLGVTFPAGFLRVVFEGDRLLDARLVPLVIDGYRPVPVTGAGAARVRTLANGAALMPGSAARLDDGRVGIVVGETGSPGLVASDGRIVDRVERRVVTMLTGPDGIVEVEPGTFVSVVPSTVEVGRDLLGWGWFDDTEADGVEAGGALWNLGPDGGPRVVDGALRLTTRDGWVRPVARIPIPRHRLFDQDGTPLDGAPRYSLRFQARAPIDLDLAIRVDAYQVDDTDPWRPPTSRLTGRTELRLPVGAAAEPEGYDVEIPEAAVEGADAIMLSLRAEARRSVAVTLDDVRLLEWRRPPVGWVPADALRSVEPFAEVRVTALRP